MRIENCKMWYATNNTNSIASILCLIYSLFFCLKIDFISKASESFLKLCNEREIFSRLPANSDVSNSEAQSFLDYFRTEPTFTKAIDRLHGENPLSHSIVTTIDGTKYVIPSKCKFFIRDIRNLDGIDLVKQYNLIVIDPPWWNKYIRRTRNKQKHYGYLPI